MHLFFDSVDKSIGYCRYLVPLYFVWLNIGDETDDHKNGKKAKRLHTLLVGASVLTFLYSAAAERSPITPSLTWCLYTGGSNVRVDVRFPRWQFTGRHRDHRWVETGGSVFVASV